GHHQEDRAGAGQDGADQARIHPASREKEGGLTVKLFKGHYTSMMNGKDRRHRAPAGDRTSLDDGGIRTLRVVWLTTLRNSCFEPSITGIL
ncbi:MAG: hypothetical protein ACREYE_04200, partial [Gammaproteobacteria bacterium]